MKIFGGLKRDLTLLFCNLTVFLREKYFQIQVFFLNYHAKHIYTLFRFPLCNSSFSIKNKFQVFPFQDEDSKIPAYHTAPYFNPYPNSNSLNSTQNHFTNTDYECQPYLSYLQVSHHLQTNLIKQEGTTSLRVCGSNNNRNDFDNSSSTSRSSVHMNHHEICPTNQQQDADYLERTSYQSLNPVSYASSVASSGSGDELRIAEEVNLLIFCR